MPLTITPEEAFERYRPLVEENDQAEPILVMAMPEKTLDKEPSLAMVPLSQIAPHPRYSLAVVKEMLDRSGFHPDWVLFSSETWQKVSDDPSDLDLEFGELERRAHRGEEVAEAVLISWKHRDGSGWTMSRGFKRVEGVVTWFKDGPTSHLYSVEDSLEGVLDEQLKALLQP